ncbi:ATP-binding protein [Moritella sp. 28]|nr:ATP-binding protein [Moritella sp. 28]
MIMTDSSQQYLCRTTYLIDSFWPGKLLELNNTGNIKVAGTNGAGKTTLLKLPMLFWGARPGRIVERNANKKSFAAYYLPRKTSYIIFDYQRPNGTDTPQLCHVLIKSDGDKLLYRFIDHPFDIKMYLDESGNIFGDDEIKRNYRTQHRCEISSLLSVDEYAKVIQNHRDLGGKKSLRTLQQRFSMSQSPIKHIEKVVTSVFNKISNFDVIKQMIIEISQDAISSEMLSHNVTDMVNIDKTDIDSWLADLHSSQAILNLEDKILSSLTDIDSLIEIKKDLQHLHHLADIYQQKCSQDQDTAGTRLKDVLLELTDLKEAHRQQVLTIEDACHDEEKAHREIKHDLDKLEQEKIDFEDDEAATYEQRGSELSDFTLRLINLNNEKTQLSEKSADLSRTFTEQQQKQELDFNKHEQQLTNEISSQRQQLTTALSENKLRYATLESELRTQTQTLIDQLTEKKTPLEHTKISLNLQLKQPQIDPELADQSLQLQQNLSQCRRRISERQEAYNRVSSESQSLRQKQHQALQTNDRLKIELNHLAQQQRDVQTLLSPAKGSLHAFLVEHVPNWQSNIGRVINPELLKHLHLEPELLAAFTDAAKQSDTETALTQVQDFYGIKINLNALEHVSFTDSALAEKEQHISAQIGAKKSELEQLQQALERLNKDVEELDKQLMSSKQLLFKQTQLLTSLVNEEDELNSKLEQHKTLAIARVQTELADTELLLVQAQQALSQAKVDYQSRHNELNNERLSVHCQLETDYNQRIDSYQSSLDNLRNEAQVEAQRIADALQAALSDAGINASIFNALEAKIKQTMKAVENAKVFQQKADKYNSWLETSWSQVEPGRERLRRLDAAIQRFQQQLKDKHQDYQQSTDKLEQEKTQLDKLVTDLVLQLKGLDNSLVKLADYPAIKHDDLPEYTVNNISKLTNSQISLLGKQQSNVLSSVSKISSELKRYSKSTLQIGWLENRIESDPEMVNYRLEEAINSGEQLSYVLKNAKLLQTSTTHEVELRANDILSIYTHLSNFDRNITRTGRKLSSHMNGKQFFTALGDIKIAIRTKMDKLGYWKQLENVNEAFEAYQANTELTHDRSIPQNLIDSLDELSAVLPKNNNMQHNELFDIEFTIVENGRTTRATTPKELEDVSSTGLSYLALITFFTGLTTMLRPDASTVITWPVDELGELHSENIQAMLEMLNQHGIQIITASPSTDKSVLQLFDHLYEIDSRNKRLIQMNVDDDPLMALLNGDAKKTLVSEPELTSSVETKTSSTSTTSIIAADTTPATMQEEG